MGNSGEPSLSSSGPAGGSLPREEAGSSPAAHSCSLSQLHPHSPFLTVLSYFLGLLPLLPGGPTIPDEVSASVRSPSLSVAPTLLDAPRHPAPRRPGSPSEDREPVSVFPTPISRQGHPALPENPPCTKSSIPGASAVSRPDPHSLQTILFPKRSTVYRFLKRGPSPCKGAQHRARSLLAETAGFRPRREPCEPMSPAALSGAARPWKVTPFRAPAAAQGDARPAGGNSERRTRLRPAPRPRPARTAPAAPAPAVPRGSGLLLRLRRRSCGRKARQSQRAPGLRPGRKVVRLSSPPRKIRRQPPPRPLFRPRSAAGRTWLWRAARRHPPPSAAIRRPGGPLGARRDP